MDSLPLWLLILAYAIHITEEYYLDWKGWTKKMSGLSLSWTEFFVANGAVIILGFCCAYVGFTCPLFSYMFVGLSFVNALTAHIGTSIVKHTFSPGLLTSIFLFLPLSTWAYIIAWQKEILDFPFILITITGGIIMQSFPVAFHLLKRKI